MGPMTGIYYFSSSSKRDGCSPIIHVENHQKFQVPKMELLTYVSCMYTAYGYAKPHPQNSLIRYSIFGTWNFWWENVSFSKMRRFLWDDFHPSCDGRLTVVLNLFLRWLGTEQNSYIHHIVESKTSPTNKSKQSEGKNLSKVSSVASKKWSVNRPTKNNK